MASGKSSAGESTRPRVAIFGGGLSGIAAAVALSGGRCKVELFEGRRQLGGRATSFQDPQSGELVDHCQHVSMGCCTNLAELCRRTDIAGLFRRDAALHFLDFDGRRYDIRATRWLPAPLHLAPAFFSLRYLSLGERLAIGRTVWKLLRLRDLAAADKELVADWLRAQKQSTRAIDQFWAVILVSALGESLEKASLGAARKVIVDGFAGSAAAFELDTPRAPLGEVYGQRLLDWLHEREVDIHLGQAVRQIEFDSGGRLVAQFASRSEQAFDYAITALPWRQTANVFAENVAERLTWLAGLREIGSSPIAGVHLWFDRPITNLPHAVIVGRLSQWLFSREQPRPGAAPATSHYYQVVISASHALAQRERQQVIDEVHRDLVAIFPAAREAKLISARVVMEQMAVFSARPGLEALRPPQATAVPGLFVAGDWTATGWPSTMEGAVRSGFLAAEGVLRAIGSPEKVLVDDLPRSWLARWLIR